ncbi:hypothetical protein DFQ28_002551 [Apophysomyces sp. BC1034]|nr:hypothetical protein DFQ30_006817 [Apophysomyces sp. BC1015]KAG0179114.1 hypothetical protein DFQ29_002504 [Apophysomyces sp. BC1021]KAG0193903.1 hypothetical protein DFQ28_002551 [Apophysomyces sp. BC1034]
MSKAFAALKRNRSTSTSKTTSAEPVSKLSKLKSGLAIFSKLTSSVVSVTHNGKKQRWKWTETPLATYSQDSIYERRQYKKKPVAPSRSILDLKKSDVIPAAPKTSVVESTKTPSSILIKRKPSIIKFSESTSFDNTYCSCHRNTLSRKRSGYRTRNWNYIPYYSSLLSSSDGYASNITANSEDLTAKEFANITGIRILPEDDEDEDRKICCDEDIAIHTVSTHSGLSDHCYYHYQSHQRTCHDDDEKESLYSGVSIQSRDTSFPHRKLQYQIWDSEFWQKPENMHPSDENGYDSADPVAVDTTHMTENVGRKPSQRSTATMTTIQSERTIPGEPPILQELRRMSSKQNGKSLNHDAQKVDSSRNCVIRKGRFEIHLETADKKNQTEDSITPDLTLCGHLPSKYPPTDVQKGKKSVCILRNA